MEFGCVKGQRYRYMNSDMVDLENQLKKTKDARHRLIATDGVFFPWMVLLPN
ncbi:MAG: hypothetical protein Ct9H300mP2_3630 [Candidatus Neomarinimicrobiota bacterium]|nr:MAG: hypothetical protein Ct9H300mP2_3630 [Candidatus Neomarinimicrobiota bacterium]